MSRFMIAIGLLTLSQACSEAGPTDSGEAGDGGIEPDADASEQDGSSCPVACSVYGRCGDGVCACDEGYVGATCDTCAAGLRWNQARDRCVSPLCDPDPCSASGMICDNATGTCCSEACEVGAVRCADGSQQICETTVHGCSAWSQARTCEEGACLCPTNDPDVQVFQWQARGTEPSALLLAANGELLQAGGSGGSLEGYTNAGGYDMFVRAFSFGADVEERWGMQWGSSEADFVFKLSLGADGAVYAAGKMGEKYGDYPHFGGDDGSVTKWNPDRSLAWHHQWGTQLYDATRGLAVDSDGSVIFAGSTYGDFQGTSAGSEDLVLRKLDAQGKPVWTERWGTSGRDFAKAVALDADGGILVAGTLNTQGFCRRLRANRSVDWTYTLGSAESGNTANVVLPLSGGGAIVGGYVRQSNGSGFVARLDAAGHPVWEAFIGTSELDMVDALTLGPDGDLYIAGETAGALVAGEHQGEFDAFVQRRTLDGEVVWTKQFGTAKSEYEVGVAVSSDGTVYVGGMTSGAFPGFHSTGAFSAFILKLAADR